MTWPKLPTLETSEWYALLMPAYALVLLAEWAEGRRRQQQWFSFAETLSNLSAGLGTLLIGLGMGPLVLGLYSWAHQHLALFAWPSEGWLAELKWPVGLLISDLCYYLWHRAGHTFGALWAIHGVHHQHEHLNSTVGLRLEWPGDLLASIFFVPMPLLGIDPTTGFSAIAFLSAYTLTAHMPLLDRPSLGIFVTPRIHGAHHSRDLRFAGKNYGAMLSIWDRLLGTYREQPAGEPLRQDVPSICRMHDGVSAQVSLLRELWRDLQAAPSWRARLDLLVLPPDGSLRAAPPLRDEAELGPAERLLLLSRFLMAVALGGWVWWLRAHHSTWVLVSGGVLACWALRLLGGRLDDRPGTGAEEWVHAGCLALVAATWAGPEPVGAALALASMLLLLGGQRLHRPSRTEADC